MRALITGAAGFVATHLASHLQSHGDQILGTILPTTDQCVSDSIATVPWNLAKPISQDSFANIIEFNPQVIYHLAAISKPSDCGTTEPAALARQVNIEGTAAILELARQLDGPVRIVFSSSSRVYSSVDQSSDADHHVNEQAAAEPISGYGKSKREAEKLLLESSGHPVEVVIARAFNHTGVGQLPIYLVPQWCQSLQENPDKISVYSLHSHLDLSDVRDITSGYRLLAQHGKDGEIYNLGSGLEISTQRIYDQLLNLSGASPEVEQASTTSKYEPIADLTKIKHDTGYSPTISLEQTLRTLWESGLKN
ncbi:MAG: NAD-dependent epimerase/dehydratase family protein [Pirellulales bacterium]